MKDYQIVIRLIVITCTVHMGRGNYSIERRGALFKPARQPLTNWIRLHLPPLKILMMKSTARPPPMQPRRVLVMASATTLPSPAEEIRP